MSTTEVTETVMVTSSDALFRRVAKVIGDAIKAVGMTQCTSPEVTTTQINFTTVTRSGSTLTEVGFEVYKSSGANFTWYVRVGYCSGQSTSQCGITFRVGTAVDTSGNVNSSGNYTPIMWIVPPSANGLTDVTWKARASSNAQDYLCLAFWDDQSNAGTTYLGGVFTVSRSRDSNGAVTNSYVHVQCHSNVTAVTAYAATLPISYCMEVYNPSVGTIYPNATIGPRHRPWSLSPPNFWSEANNATTNPKRVDGGSQSGLGMFPTFPYEGGPGNHCLDCCVYCGGDFDVGVASTVPIYGANHQFMPIGGISWRNLGVSSVFSGDNGNVWPTSFAIFWE